MLKDLQTRKLGLHQSTYLANQLNSTSTDMLWRENDSQIQGHPTTNNWLSPKTKKMNITQMLHKTNRDIQQAIYNVSSVCDRHKKHCDLVPGNEYEFEILEGYP